MKANESTPEIPETALMSQLDPTFQVDFPRLQIVCEGSTPCVTFPSCHQTQLKSCGLWSRYNLRRILEVVAVLNLPAASCQWPASPQTVPLVAKLFDNTLCRLHSTTPYVSVDCQLRTEESLLKQNSAIQGT